MGCGVSKDAVKPEPLSVEEVPKPPPPPVQEQHVQLPIPAREPAPEPERPVAATVPSTVLQPTAFLGEANGQKAAKNISITEIKTLMQQLTDTTENPYDGLEYATRVLQETLGVDLVSITQCLVGSASYLTLTAQGAGADLLQWGSLMRGADWSAFQLETQASHVYITVQGDNEEERALPRDWELLHKEAGLNSFFMVPIGTATEILGMLTVAHKAVDAFDEHWWEATLSMLAVGLLSQLHNPHVQQVCQLIGVLDTTRDHLSFISSLLLGVQQLLLCTTNVQVGVRLGLINDEEPERAEKALIYEPDNSSRRPSGMEGGTTNNPDPSSVLITQISLANTLLSDAVESLRARFISDCAKYLQSCMWPATDIFISPQRKVAAIVVLPVVYSGQRLGGMYFTTESANNFQSIKGKLKHIVTALQPLLHARLSGHMHEVWQMMIEQQPQLDRAEGTTATLARDGEGSLKISPTSPATAGTGGADGSSIISPGAGASQSGASASINKKLLQKRQCTEAMLAVMQDEVRKAQARGRKEQWLEDLVLLEILGKGGFGTVFRGLWRGTTAAVKVMYARQHERQAMKDALEMAVLTTLSHPHIVQMYSCLTNMVEDAGAMPGPSDPNSQIALRFRQLQPGEDTNLATCSVMIMELCDKGNLRQAIRRGLCHKRLQGNFVAVDLSTVVQVLLQLAHSLQYLHSVKLLHCDIKPENVLLKSDSSHPLGFVVKLSDFGLSKLLREKYYIINRSGSGTVTHLAPELFKYGTKLTTAVDSFSFGILMWEMYTGQRAYSGLGRSAIISHVTKQAGRPVFPSSTPEPYSSLAIRCWDSNPALRPGFQEIITQLQQLLQDINEYTYADPQSATQTMGSISRTSMDEVVQ